MPARTCELEKLNRIASATGGEQTSTELWMQLLTVAEVPQRLLAPNSTLIERAARNKLCRHFRFGLMISSTHVKAATAVGNPEVVTASSTTCSISFGVAPTSSAR